MYVPEHVRVLVWHHGLIGAGAADVLAADDARDVAAFRLELLEAGAKLGTLGRSGRVGEVRLVDRTGGVEERMVSHGSEILEVLERT